MADPVYHLRLLGDPVVVDDRGEPRSVPTGKPFALLYYLSRHPDGVERERLVELLWPGRDRSRGLHSLRQALWRLRSELDEGVLADGDPVALVPGRVTSDVEAVEAALEAGKLERASKLWDAAPLERLRIRDTPAWDRWADGERIRVESLMAAALREAAQRALNAGESDVAAHHAERALAIQPSSTSACDLLIEACTRQGNEPRLRQALARAREQARDDENRLQALAAVEARAAAMEHAVQEAGEGADEDPRVLSRGREGIHADLMAGWRRAREGRGGVAVLCGAPGFGRRTLARLVRAAAKADGAREVPLILDEASRETPWTAFRYLIRELLPLPGAAGISPASDRILQRLVPSRSGPGSSDSGRGLPEPVLMADALLDLLDAVGDENPLLLYIEDLHRIDARSWEVLRIVLRDLQDSPVFALLTDLSLGPGTERSLALDALAMRPHVTAHCLEPWRPEVLRSIAQARCETLDDDQVSPCAEWVATHSAGHPALSLALLDALESMPRHEARQTIRNNALPETLSSEIQARLASLSTPALRLAFALTRRGGPSHPDPLLDSTGLSDTVAGEALRELLEAGIIQWTGPHGDRLDLLYPALRGELVRWNETLAPDPPAPADRRRLLLLVALLIVVAGGALWITPTTPSPAATEEPWGSVVLLDRARGIAAITKPHAQWDETLETLPLPDVGTNARIALAHLAPDGSFNWFVEELQPGVKPWVSLRAGGESETVVRTEGDDFLLDVSPDGRSVLVGSEPVEAEAYRRDLFMVTRTAEGSWGEPTLLVEGEMRVTPARFSHDGRRIAAVRQGAPDSLLLLTPGGQRVAALPSEVPITSLAWCGEGDEDGPWLLAVLDAPMGERLHRIDPPYTALTSIPERGYVAQGAACNPSGTEVIYPSGYNGEPVIVVLDLGTGEHDVLPIRVENFDLRWLPSTPPLTPRRLVVPDTTLRIDWGGMAEPAVEVEMSDGSRTPATGLTWESRDPSVAAVSRMGVVHGNAPGFATLVARWDGWLEAEVQVQVSHEPAPAVLFTDPLDTLDPDRWIPVGWPPVQIVELDGAPVLSMEGDALYRDGILTRDPILLPRGGTVEVEFRLALTRHDKQWFRLCLVDSALPHAPTDFDAPGLEWEGLSPRQAPCIRYPLDQFARMEDDGVEIQVQRGFGNHRAPAPGLLPSDDWVHLALQLRADGELSVWVEREHVFTGPVHLDTAPETGWRVAILGASYETELFVRDLRVRDGPQLR